MDRVQRAVIVTRLARKMREKGSWCGETHLQKAIYLAQELLKLPTGFEFVLYKHGPFSFDFRDELTALRANMMLEIEPQPRPFGPRLAPTGQSERIEALFPKTLTKLDHHLRFIAENLCDKGVAELESLATAQFIKKENNNSALDEQVKRINQLKPHVSLNEARVALERVTELSNQAELLPC